MAFGIDDAIQAVGQVGAAAIGAVSAGAARGDAQAATDKAVAGWEQLSLPELRQLVAQQLGPSALEGISDNPDLAQAQLQSLAQLGDIANSGGQTLTDRVNLTNDLSQGAQHAEATRKAIQNLVARQGGGLGGASVAMQLGAARDQQAAAAQAGASNAAQAQQRAIQAITARAQQAGQMRSQDFSEAAQKAHAADLINQYNANARTDASKYNNSIAQQRFGDSVQRQTGASGAYENQASADTQTANRTQQQITDAGGGIAGVLGSAVKGLTGGQAAPQTDYGSVTPAQSLDPNDPRYRGY